MEIPFHQPRNRKRYNNSYNKSVSNIICLKIANHCYYKGEGVEQDYEEAVKYYRKN